LITNIIIIIIIIIITDKDVPVYALKAYGAVEI